MKTVKSISLNEHYEKIKNQVQLVENSQRLNREFSIELGKLEAENTGLRAKLQGQALELEEYRRVLLALVRGIEGLPGENWHLLPYLRRIELEIQDAREILARGGLL